MKKSVFASAILLGATCCFVSRAQDNPVELILSEKLETIAEASDAIPEFTELEERLDRLLKHPIDLNSSQTQELVLAGLINQHQLRALAEHISKTGKLIEIEELQTIDGFDTPTIVRLKPFVTVGAVTNPSALMKNGKNQISIRMEKVIQRSAGYIPKNPSQACVYPGSELKIASRYLFTGKNISWGFTAEKDPGEEFFREDQKLGFDFYSGHVALKDIGFIRKLAAGDYLLHYGQGLTLWQGMTFGKTADVGSIEKTGEGITAYRSYDENNFMRGIAIGTGRKKIGVDIFLSKKAMDANGLVYDSMRKAWNSFTSFQSSGYHRTTSELQDKDAVDLLLYGTHITYHDNRFSLGATIVRSELSALQQHATGDLYKIFESDTRNSVNVGLDYNYSKANFNFFGETATRTGRDHASVNGILLSLGHDVTFTTLYRTYSKNYQSLFSSGFGESSNTHNENGIYTGLQFKPSGHWSVSAYHDIFQFPWLRYEADAPSGGSGYLMQVNFDPSKSLSAYIRYRQKTKTATTVSQAIDKNANETSGNIRIHLSVKINDDVVFRSRFEWVGISSSQGYCILQDIVWKAQGAPLSISLRYALFDTDDYSSRIYAYENSLPETFSIPAYYYRGSRIYINTHYRFPKNWDAFFWYGQTTYVNQNTIGTGNDQINGNTRSEGKIQVVYTF